MNIEDAQKAGVKYTKKDIMSVDSELDGKHYRDNTGKDLFTLCKEGLMTRVAYKSALVFNIFKYLMRYENKGSPLKDLKKARNYLDELIKVVEEHE